MRHSYPGIKPGIKEEINAEAVLRDYAGRITTAYEEERRRIARDLHDEVASSMLVLINRLDILAGSPGLKEAGKEIATARQYAVEALEAVRRTAQGLRPRILDDLGLTAAIEWLADELENNSDVTATVATQGELPSLSGDVQTTLFRIAQEALNNIRKHAGAATAEIIIRGEPQAVVMEITDNGKGFEMPGNIAAGRKEDKLGLVGMRERVALMGGSLTVESEPGKGTCIEVKLPLNEQRNGSASGC